MCHIALPCPWFRIQCKPQSAQKLTLIRAKERPAAASRAKKTHHATPLAVRKPLSVKDSAVFLLVKYLIFTIVHETSPKHCPKSRKVKKGHHRGHFYLANRENAEQRTCTVAQAAALRQISHKRHLKEFALETV